MWKFCLVFREHYSQTDVASLVEGEIELEAIRKSIFPLLEKISVDDEKFVLNSIKNHPKVILIKKTVQRINSAVIKWIKAMIKKTAMFGYIIYTPNQIKNKYFMVLPTHWRVYFGVCNFLIYLLHL